MGTNVSERISDPSSAKEIVNASGANIFPSKPSSVNSGRKTILDPTWAGALVLALEDGFRLHRLIDPETTSPDSFFRAIGDLQRSMGISSA